MQGVRSARHPYHKAVADVWNVAALSMGEIILGGEWAQMASDLLQRGNVKEVIFIDTGIADWQSLVNGAPEGAEIVTLDPSRDGLAQMAQWAEGKLGYTAIHILTHGSQGQVQLGTASLNSDTLANYSDALIQIGQSLTESGDILVYGCNVAAEQVGVDFIGKLAQATKADIAASDDLTGAAEFGGNWALEKQVGFIEATDLTAWFEESYSQTLGQTQTTDVIGTVDNATIVASTDGGVGIGQTFTATRNGILKEIQVVTDGNADLGTDWTVTIYKGSGVGGEVIASQTGPSFENSATTLNDYSYHVITLNSLVSLESGQIYSFYFTPAESIDLAYAEESYSDGNIIYDNNVTPGFDLIFKVVQTDAAPANTAPTISDAPSDITVTEGTASNVDLSDVTFADVDGDDLTVILTASAGT